MKPEGSIGLHSVHQSLSPSVRHTRFPDFSLLCFHLFGWKLVASFCMKSYRSSSSFVTVDLLLHELLPFVIKIHFPGFLAQLSRRLEWAYENQEWPRVPDRKISVEGDMLWHNPNRGVSRGLDVKARRPRLISSVLEREVILDSFSRWNLTRKRILLAFLFIFDT